MPLIDPAIDAYCPTPDRALHGAGVGFDALQAYCRDVTRPESAVLAELEAETRKTMKRHGMLCGRTESRLLRMLVQICGAKRILEIGTFTGYSALAMAEVLPADGKLITCDIDEESTALAKRAWAKSSHGSKIELRLGKALETIASLTGPFDFVFIDADKPSYPAYYDAVLPKMKAGGLIALDNAFLHGEVLAPKDESGKIMNELNRRIGVDARVENVLLSVRDGIHLVRVK